VSCEEWEINTCGLNLEFFTPEPHPLGLQGLACLATMIIQSPVDYCLEYTHLMKNSQAKLQEEVNSLVVNSKSRWELFFFMGGRYSLSYALFAILEKDEAQFGVIYPRTMPLNL
jgi:hypothetical protein